MPKDGKYEKHLDKTVIPAVEKNDLYINTITVHYKHIKISLLNTCQHSITYTKSRTNYSFKINITPFMKVGFTTELLHY